MTRIATAALGAAALSSLLSIADAVAGGLGDHLLSEEDATGWATTGTSLLLGATFALLAAVLAQRGRDIDAGRRSVRAVRLVLTADLTLLAVLFIAGILVARYPDTVLYRAWGAVSGTGFLLMFVAGVILGALLLRRPELRTGAILLTAPLVIIPLTIAANAMAPGWGHPGYAETALYLGVALLGLEPVPARPVGVAR
ncbi:hypothetical protein OHA21_23970 [Actinoplanes sp. NBC_00393]|uniref:hypothetical protein n=1 Tax=Actinoplanes sp. NBC_00393 TaxID=2975953 RepID=UPI002E1BB8E2